MIGNMMKRTISVWASVILALLISCAGPAPASLRTEHQSGPENWSKAKESKYIQKCKKEYIVEVNS